MRNFRKLCVELPAVANNRDGISELVQHSRNGLLVYENTVLSCQDTLSRLSGSREFLLKSRPDAHTARCQVHKALVGEKMEAFQAGLPSKTNVAHKAECTK
jgi:hypothetical protein